jgi:ABC-2 type transport system ATP-binding protein
MHSSAPVEPFLPVGAPASDQSSSVIGRDGKAVIDVLGLHRTFASGPALESVDLAVHPGEVRALLGPNGAGKSTLLRILTGLVDPSAGSVRVLDHDGRGARNRAAIGLVPAGDRTLYLRLTGLENLVFFGRLQGLVRREATKRAVEVLGAVGLDGVGTKRVNQYSHGMQKRLSIARAMLCQPRVLLLDESTHDLDPLAGEQIRKLVRAKADEDGVAVLWATQRLEEIRDFADTVTVLDRGHVRFSGTVLELMGRADRSTHLIQVAPSGPALVRRAREALAGLATVYPSSTPDTLVTRTGEGASLGAVVSRLEAHGIAVLTARAERNEVESAFLAMVGGGTHVG